MAIIPRRLKDGTRYRVIVRDSFGKYFPEKSFATLKEAKVYERQLNLKKDDGLRSIPSHIRQITLASYWLIWSRECRQKVSEGWRLTQEELWKNHIQPFLGGIKVSDVHTQHIAALLNHLHEPIGLSSQSRLA